MRKVGLVLGLIATVAVYFVVQRGREAFRGADDVRPQSRRTEREVEPLPGDDDAQSRNPEVAQEAFPGHHDKRAEPE